VNVMASGPNSVPYDQPFAITQYYDSHPEHPPSCTAQTMVVATHKEVYTSMRTPPTSFRVRVPVQIDKPRLAACA
jgi:hypothetical protein